LKKKEQSKEDTREPMESIEISIPDKIDKNLEDQCPACKNGDQPSGAHVCYICQKNVHALDSCSASVGEEDYGQKRICKNCRKQIIYKI